MVIGVVLMAAASKAPLESLFILGTLSLGPEALGLIMGSWGLGMLLGSVAAPALCRRWQRERVLALMIFVVAICVFAAFQFVTNIAFLSGAFLAGWLGTHYGIRLSYVFSGVLFLFGGILCRMV